MAQSTMGALAEWRPPAEEEMFYNNVINILDELYPGDWRLWVVNTLRYEDLFGEKIPPDTECRLRFAVPTVKLAKAHSSDESTLSERRYKKIKRILLSWPLGRALIYVPLSVMAKIHSIQAFNKFSEVIPVLKPHLISRHEASKQLTAGENTSEAESNQSSRLTSKRSHSPSPMEQAKKPKFEELITQQNMMLEKMCEMMQVTNTNINNVMMRQENKAKESPTPYYQDQETCSSRASNSVDNNRTAPPMGDEIFSEIVPEQNEEPLEDFAPDTKESEAKISKASQAFVEQAITCQKFNSEGWANVRYAEVQKLFQAAPAFTALKVNGNLASITPNWQLVATLEKMDQCLGAITHGLLQQRQAFQDTYQNATPEIKGYISKKFLVPDTPFRKLSDTLLQYVCGRRAEVIQQRRGLYKPTNRTISELLNSIPPSEHHIFAEPKLADFVKEQGGTSKLFPGTFRKPTSTTSRNQVRSAANTAAATDNKEFKGRSQPFNNYRPQSGPRRNERSRFPAKRVPTKQNKNSKKFKISSGAGE